MEFIKIGERYFRRDTHDIIWITDKAVCIVNIQSKQCTTITINSFQINYIDQFIMLNVKNILKIIPQHIIKYTEKLWINRNYISSIFKKNNEKYIINFDIFIHEYHISIKPMDKYIYLTIESNIDENINKHIKIVEI